MKRIFTSTILALLLLASSAFGQGIIGGGIIGGGGKFSNPNFPTVLQGLQAWYSADQGTYQDAAIQLTAADKSWLTVADNASLSMGSGVSLTICGWFKADGVVGTAQVIVSKSAGVTGTAGLEYAVYLNGSTNKPIFVVGNGSVAGTAAWTGTINTATWYFFVAKYDHATQVLSINVNEGTAITTASVAAIHDSTNAFNVGIDFVASGRFLNGSLDSLMLFKSALSSEATAILYNSGAGRLCSEITTAQKTAWGAISGYDLGETSGKRFDSWGSNHLDQAFAELVTNGTFTGNSTGWTEGAGWAYGTNNEAATAAEADLTQTAVVPTVGKLYSTSFAAAVTSGTLRLNFGGVTGTTRSTTATHTETMRATSTASLVIEPVAAYTGTVDTVSVMAAEILPAPGIVRGLCVDGDGLSYWLDLSGEGNHASIETLAMRPIYQTSEINSLPILDFDGVDDQLTTALRGLQAATIVAVVKGGADGDGYVGVNDSMIGVAAGPVIAGVVASHTTATVVSDEDPTADYRIVCLSYGGNGTAESLHVDGTEEYAGTQSGDVTVDADTYTVGAVDSGGTIGTFGDCQIAWLAIYNRALSASERNFLTAALRNKFALSP